MRTTKPAEPKAESIPMRMPLPVEPSLPWILITMLVPSCARSGHPAAAAAAPGPVMRGVGVGGMKEVEKVLAVKMVVSSSIIDLRRSHQPMAVLKRGATKQT